MEGDRPEEKGHRRCSVKDALIRQSAEEGYANHRAYKTETRTEEELPSLRRIRHTSRSTVLCQTELGRSVRGILGRGKV